jgi:hypothetical protein
VDVDGKKPLAEGIEEEEDGEMKEDGDAVSQASQLESGKAVEKIGTHSATFVRCGIRL